MTNMKNEYGNQRAANWIKMEKEHFLSWLAIQTTSPMKAWEAIQGCCDSISELVDVMEDLWNSEYPSTDIMRLVAHHAIKTALAPFHDFHSGPTRAVTYKWILNEDCCWDGEAGALEP